MISKKEFQEWKKEAETTTLVNGYSIKIVNAELNLAKNILCIIFIIFVIVVIIMFSFGFNVGALELDENILTVKILYQLDFSDELKDYVDEMINRTWEEYN